MAAGRLLAAYLLQVCSLGSCLFVVMSGLCYTGAADSVLGPVSALYFLPIASRVKTEMQ